MTIIRMDTSLKAIGAFWPPDDPNKVITGTLSTIQGRPHLLVSPQFKTLTPEETSAIASQLGTDRPARRIDTLIGRTKDGPCTLFYLVETLSDGVTHLPKQLQLLGERWRIGSALMGLHVDSAESDTIESGAFYFTSIHEWLPSATQFKLSEEGQIFVLPRQALQFFCFQSAALEAEVICEIFPGKTREKSVPRIRITPRQPKSLKWFLLLRPRLENFFSLFLGSSGSVKAIQLFRGDQEDGWFVQRTKIRKESTDVESWVRCSSSEVAIALEKWLSVPEEKRPVERTVLGMIRKSSLFTETEFLALAQALEGYGRLRFEGGLIPKGEFKQGLTKLRETLVALWGESEITKRCTETLSTANESSYGFRIGQTYDLLTPEFAANLLGDRGKFVQRIVQTRNYFTHLGIRKQTAVVNDAGDLFYLNQRLHALLRCVMLLDLGLGEDLLRDAISRQATRWKSL